MSETVRQEMTRRGNYRNLHYRDGKLYRVSMDDENTARELAAIMRDLDAKHWSHCNV